MRKYPKHIDPWMLTAFRELNLFISEAPGQSDNPRIIEYLRSTNLHPAITLHDEIAWCSAFVNYCIMQSKHNGTRSAMARSWCSWGKHTPIRFGAIVTLWRLDPEGQFGHVGFCITRDIDTVWLLGGNQSNALNIKGYPISRVLSSRKPA